jgi:micrococcal nuclease
MAVKGRRKKRLRWRSIWKILFLLLLGLGLFGFAKGKVVKVADGDTVTVLSAEGRMERVRLQGIDSPEFDQPGGLEAKEFCSDLALFKEVELTPLGRDDYGRTVALLRLPGGRLLNEELVRNGQAWVSDKYCTQPWCIGWRELQKKARQQKLGLWANPKAVPPWVWKRNKKVR